MDYTDIGPSLRSGITFLLRGKAYRFSCFVETKDAFVADILDVVDLETEKRAFIGYEEIVRAVSDGKFQIPNLEFRGG